jgi:hypothetical protein
VLAVGAESIVLAINPRQRPQLERLVARWTVDSIVAALQILAEYRTRLRGSLHGRLLVELALIRVAQLEDLRTLHTLVERLTALETGAPLVRRREGGGEKKKQGPMESSSGPTRRTPQPDRLEAEDSLPSQPATAAAAPPGSAAPASTGVLPAATPPLRTVGANAPAAAIPSPPRAGPTRPTAESEPSPSAPQDGSPPLDLEMVRQVWPDLIKQLSTHLKWRIRQVEPIAIIGSHILVIASKPGYNSDADACGTPEALKEIEQCLQRVIHRPINLRYERSPAADGVAPETRHPAPQRQDTLMADPMVQKVVELFEARSVQLDYDGPESTSPS